MNNTIPPETEAQRELRSLEQPVPSEQEGQTRRRDTLHQPLEPWGILPSPRRTINVLVIVMLLGVGFLDYWQYSRTYHSEPSVYLDVIAGTGSAPAQYRIGVLDTAHFLAMHTHLPLRDWLTTIDFGSSLVAIFALLLVVRRSRTYASAGQLGRWLSEFVLLGMVQYFLAWLTWYQRPETLPTSALLALGLLFLAVPIGSAHLQPFVSAAGVLGVTLAQSFVRADVVFAFNLGVLLVCLLSSSHSFVLQKRAQAVVCVAGALLAVSTQLLLMRVIFPHATYGSTPVFQLLDNLKAVSGYPPFLIVMMPVGWAIWRVVARKSSISGPEAAMLVAACIFTCMWAIIGITQEVRIFLPYGLVLIPLMVTLLMQMIGEASYESASIA